MKLPRRPRSRPPLNPTPTGPADSRLQAPSLSDLAPGWDALDAALAPHYGAEPTRHVGFTPAGSVGATLQGVSAYAAVGHWFYVTCGLTDLFGTQAPAARGPSGAGFELTMRVARGAEEHPPEWPFAMLNELGKQVLEKGFPLAPGASVDLRGPVTGHPQTDGPDSALTVFAFRADPVLEPFETSQGSVRFLQVVGVTAAEKAQMVTSGTENVLTQLAWSDPLLVLDPARG